MKVLALLALISLIPLLLRRTIARIFHHYIEHGTFPETISTWHTDYLRSVNNCPIDDPVVVQAKNEAIAGKTTEYDKAKAPMEGLIKYHYLDTK